ncbi:MAG: universal stress protein, partial [Gammaproteobacteria bacterium]|nr:universal stress protein [Gammaproteobacteria bacterium]
ILLYVVEPMMYPSGMGEVVDLDYISLENELEENGRRTLQTIIDEQLQGTSNPGYRIRKGNAHKEIIAAASEEGCSMVIIATHGYSGFRHLMLGSVAEKVVRGSGVPVLTLPHE